MSSGYLVALSETHELIHDLKKKRALRLTIGAVRDGCPSVYGFEFVHVITHFLLRQTKAALLNVHCTKRFGSLRCLFWTLLLPTA